MSAELKSTTEKKTTSDANSTIMRPAAKASIPATTPATHNHPPHMDQSRQTEKAVEKAVAAAMKAEVKAPTPAAPASTSSAAKAAKKEDKKADAAALSGKPAKKKGKKSTWVKKNKVKKDVAAKEMQATMNEKWKPNFWGRFGKKNLRTQRDPKYAKWRKPRGIDILRERNDGELPNSGFQSPKAYRFVHPSGYREVLVQTKRDLDKMKPMYAARFARTIGRKKRIELIQYANTKNIPILN